MNSRIAFTPIFITQYRNADLKHVLFALSAAVVRNMQDVSVQSTQNVLKHMLVSILPYMPFAKSVISMEIGLGKTRWNWIFAAIGYIMINCTLQLLYSICKPVFGVLPQ